MNTYWGASCRHALSGKWRAQSCANHLKLSRRPGQTGRRTRDGDDGASNYFNLIYKSWFAAAPRLPWISVGLRESNHASLTPTPRLRLRMCTNTCMYGNSRRSCEHT